MNKRTRTVALLLSIIAVFMMFPCLPVQASSMDEDRAFWENLSGHYYYDRLTPSEKAFYDALNDRCINIMLSSEDNPNQTINIASLCLSYDQMTNVFSYFLSDKPQYYFVRNGYSYTYALSTGVILSVSSYMYEDFQNGTTRSEMTNKLKNEINAWDNAIDSRIYDDLPAYVELIVHDYVINMISYDKSSVYNGQNIVSAFINKTTVCSGYSKAFQILMRLQGIETICVESDNHMWNLVNLHGYWYHVDVTNDDQPYEEIQHYFFNRSMAFLYYEDKEYGNITNAFLSKMPTNTECIGMEINDPYFEYDGNIYFVVNLLGGGLCKKVSSGGSNPHTVPIGGVEIEVSNSPIPLPSGSGTSRDMIRAFVERMYTCVLGRPAEEEGCEYWTEQLYNYRCTGAQCAEFFLFSDEFKSRNLGTSDYLNTLYKSFFNREFDLDGKNYWDIALCLGVVTKEDIAYLFINSQEWADTCAKYSIRSGGTASSGIKISPSESTVAFVERLYVTALNRPYDPSGRDYWADLLANYNITGEFAGAQFFLSPEFKEAGLDDSEFVERLYLTFMDRPSDQSGKEFWLDCLKNGSTREEVIYGFTRSPEFVQRCTDARIIPY